MLFRFAILTSAPCEDTLGCSSPEVNAQDASAARGKQEAVTARPPRFRDFQIRDVVGNGAAHAILAMMISGPFRSSWGIGM
jgi:hypothetical protein